MKEARRFYHLTQLRDALNRVGTIMYRGSLKYTLIMSIGTSLGHQLPKVGLPGLDEALVVLLPVLVFVVFFGGGLALRYIPNIISLGRIATAEAADFNLMNDYRKAELEEHLEAIWDRIFSYEAAIRYSEREIQAEERIHSRYIPRLHRIMEGMDGGLLQYLGTRRNGNPDERVDDLVEALLLARPQCDRLEKTRRAFVTSTRYALRQHLEQEEQTRRIGFDISQWEDWRDSAYFHAHDRHIAQQFDGNPVLQAAKEQAGWDQWDHMRQLPARVWQKVWSRLLSRAISIHLGTAIDELNGHYPVQKVGRRFKSQLIMWPGAEREAPWLDDLPRHQPKRSLFRRTAAYFLLRQPDLPRPAARLWNRIGTTLLSAEESGCTSPREEVQARRHLLIRSRFGRTFHDAREVIDRVYLASFKLATELRMAYDVQYAAGMLEQNPAGDYEKVKVSGVDATDLRDRSRQTREELENFLSEAAAIHPQVQEDREIRRAAALAFHTDRDGLRSEYRKDNINRSQLREWLLAVVEDRKSYSHRLQEVRMHQTLSLLQIQGARRYIRRLAYPEAPDEEKT